MASAQLSRTPSYNGSSIPPSRALSRTRGILIETMQLVEPRKEVPVPNHLLESKIYSKVAHNSVIQATPAVIHFGGFELGKTHRVSLDLANISSIVQRMHIIPPQTKYFYIKYKKHVKLLASNVMDRLVPGLALECTVEFIPDEWRYYYDCIRVHTQGEENLIIPIHAYPVMDTSDFPEHISFPPVPVGQSFMKTIPLRQASPIDFEFQLTVLQSHPAFTINPLAGVIPANDEVEITVTFAPKEFSTATMTVQLILSQFNAKKLVCSFSGYSEPGLEKLLSLKEKRMDDVDPSLDPRCISPLDRARSKRHKLKKSLTGSASKGKEMERDGIKFPANLDTPYAVAQVLNQEAGKLRIKDLRQAVVSKDTSMAGGPTRQMKEAMFEMAVRKDVYEERQNQLRWQVKLGDDQITANNRLQVLKAREAAWQEYKIMRGDPVMDYECRRTTTLHEFKCTRRDVKDIAQDMVCFDMYSNNVWAVRQQRLWQFQQAVRSVIIRCRAERKLTCLRQMMIDWGKNKFAQMSSADREEKNAMDDMELNVVNFLMLSKERVTSQTFPTYVPPNVKDDMAVDALGQVPYTPTDVVVSKKTPYFLLKVPSQYELLGYVRHDTHAAAQLYVASGLARPLRTGAEDELIMLHKPSSPRTATELLTDEGDMRLVDMETTTTVNPPFNKLVPPAAMFEPIEYAPLHIFNPAPGLQVLQQPLPYMETEADFHLCPLPRYISPEAHKPHNPHMATQKIYTDNEDVIRGVMTWKKFPSQGLTSLTSTPTITNVWIPRWSDGFSSDLLPGKGPALSEGLSAEDQINIEEESEGADEDMDMPALTPEMVGAQFAQIDSLQLEFSSGSNKDLSGVLELDKLVPPSAISKEEFFPFGVKMPTTNIAVGPAGPLTRDKRELELEFFLKKKHNKLGKRFSATVESMDNLKTNRDLVLM